MYTDIQLWLRLTPGLLLTVTGVICFIASFIYLVRTLYTNMFSDLPHKEANIDDEEDIKE